MFHQLLGGFRKDITVKHFLYWLVKKRHIHLAAVVFICSTRSNAFLCILNMSIKHHRSDTERFVCCKKMGHVKSYLGIYICLEVKYKGSVFRMKCCLNIMRCLCQVVTAAVILFLSFVPLFQVKFSENAFTLSALPRDIVQYNNAIYIYMVIQRH